jgi:hypothetical protein
MSPGRQFGLLWGAVAAALVALSPLAPRFASALPVCPLKSLIGLPCLTCGTTRAALALGRLDLGAAFAVSPLAAAGWSVLIVGGLAAGVASLARLEVPEPPRHLPRMLRWGAIAAVLANWAYLIWSGA